MLLGLRTAKYHVDDIAQGRAWYAKALGVQPYFDQPFYVGFNVGGFELGLDPDPRPGKEAGAGGVDVYWGVADIQAGLASEVLRARDPAKLIPPLHGALLKNEEDVHLFERLAFLHRRERSS